MTHGTNGKRWPSRDWPKRAQLSGIGTPTQRAVLVAMAVDGDYFGECSSSRSRLAEITGLSAQAVHEALLALSTIGAIKLIAEGGGRGNPARYQLTLKRPKGATTL